MLLALESGCSVQQKWGITSLYLQIRNRWHVPSIQLTFWYFKKNSATHISAIKFSSLLPKKTQKKWVRDTNSKDERKDVNEAQQNVE
jgi:hypothetical protein